MSKATSLKRIERLLETRAALKRPLKVLWHDALVPCAQHPRCDIEVATGEHHQGVIHLSFGGQRL